MSQPTGDKIVGHDQRTESYFEKNTPTYSLERYQEIVEFLRTDAGPKASLLDVGCGSGNILQLIAEHSTIKDLAGVDVSAAYLEQCAAALPGCKTYLSSILDPNLHTAVGRQFSYVMVGAVLHHLVGKSRKESLGYAQQALVGTWSLVEPGGCLIVMEPTWRPRWAMNMVFNVKRLMGKISPGRVTIMGHWNNLGEPVVSYFSHAELTHEAKALPGVKIALDIKAVKRLSPIWRVMGITERADSVLILRKEA